MPRVLSFSFLFLFFLYTTRAMVARTANNAGEAGAVIIRFLLRRIAVDLMQAVDWIEVKRPLPSGAIERFTDLPIDRYITIVEGQGQWK